MREAAGNEKRLGDHRDLVLGDLRPADARRFAIDFRHQRDRCLCRRERVIFGELRADIAKAARTGGTGARDLSVGQPEDRVTSATVVHEADHGLSITDGRTESLH